MNQDRTSDDEPTTLERRLRELLFWIKAVPVLALVIATSPICLMMIGVPYLLRLLGWEWKRWPQGLRRSAWYLGKVVVFAVIALASLILGTVILLSKDRQGYIVAAISLLVLGLMSAAIAILAHRKMPVRWLDDPRERSDDEIMAEQLAWLERSNQRERKQARKLARVISIVFPFVSR